MMQDLTETRLVGCLDQASRGKSRYFRSARLGPHIVDFLFPEARLIVELDHAPLQTSSARQAHEARQRSLEKRGYRVLRFWADHVAVAPGSITRLVSSALGRQSRHSVMRSDDRPALAHAA